MYIEKLKSGSYRITQQENGRRYRITVDHKPSNNEAVRLLAAEISKGRTAAKGTFRCACEDYIASKKNVLSPSTIKEYTGTQNRIPSAFQELPLQRITSMDVQKVVNDYAADHQPKTVANYANFIMAVLTANDISVKPPKLPQKIKKVPYIPSREDVKTILDMFKGTEYDIALHLCIFGLRRSEICALTLDDLDGNVLTINKAKVQNERKEWVIKTTKTEESTRKVVITQELADQIREQGYVYRLHPDNIHKRLTEAQVKAGIPSFSLHKLRHFFASYLHDKGYTDKQIQEMGGWKTDTVMKTVYQHAMEMDRAKQRAANDIASIF